MDSMKLAYYLKDRRIDAKISQDVLAEAMQVSRYTILNMETGATAPSFENVWKYFVILGLDLSMLQESLTSDDDEKLRTKVWDILQRDKLARQAKLAARRAAKPAKEVWTKSYAKARKPYKKRGISGLDADKYSGWIIEVEGWDE